MFGFDNESDFERREQREDLEERAYEWMIHNPEILQEVKEESYRELEQRTRHYHK